MQKRRRRKLTLAEIRALSLESAFRPLPPPPAEVKAERDLRVLLPPPTFAQRHWGR